MTVVNKMDLTKKLGFVVLVFYLGAQIAGCSLLPIAQEEQAPPAPAATLTDTTIPTAEDTATATTIPTRTLIPSPTLSPTT